MITLLYHARTVGYICKRIAVASHGAIQAICDDRIYLPARLTGTAIRWDSCAKVDAERTINSAEAVKLSRNKRKSRILLEGLCPPTWVSLKDCLYPCILRPQRHYAAHKFFVCDNRQDAIGAIRRYGLGRWYTSPIIDKKNEYRIFIFQDYAVKVVRRFHNDPDQISWNTASGGRSIRLKRESWPILSVQQAIVAGRRLGLGWFAADVITDHEGRSFVLELNTAPGLQRDKTITLLAKVFTQPLENNRRTGSILGDTWKDLIHPSIIGARSF